MYVSNPNLFVISGGPGSGKTTLLEELSRLGYGYTPEVARPIIQEQVASGGTALPWADRRAYTQLMLERSIESFMVHTPTPDLMFADRGIPDTLCYARLIGLEPVDEAIEACARYRYAPTVFLAPPWEEIYRTDSERKQDFAEAVRTYELMMDVYEECGYLIVELPKTSPVERSRFVVERVRG